jgi:hypothetical protein
MLAAGHPETMFRSRRLGPQKPNSIGCIPATEDLFHQSASPAEGLVDSMRILLPEACSIR